MADRNRRLAKTSTPSSAQPTTLESHEPLLEAIAASPDDPGPWTVYADLLQTTEHPRGELISTMLERERRPSARLFDVQRRQLAAHAAVLRPATLEPEVVVGWRRGFASELRLDSPEQLAGVQRDPSLRFVEVATLVIEDWAAWRAALAGVRLSWRHVRIEASEALDMAPILACVPDVQTLRIANATPSWDGARAPQLALLVLVNAGEVESLDDADLPALEELRLLGSSQPSDELRTSLHWSRLRRVVLAEPDETGDAETGPVVHVAAALTRDDDDAGEDYDDDEILRRSTTAFFVVGQAIQPALIGKLAARMSISHLSARVAIVRWPQPLTVIQLFGTQETDLLPYGVALALANVLDPAPPVALVEVDHDMARTLVLGDVPTRASQAGPADVVRRAIDLACGRDPGAAILQDLLDELAAAPIVTLLGHGGEHQLTMVDPSTAPLDVPEEPDDDHDEDEDEYADEDDYEDGLAESYEEPALVAEEAVRVEAPIDDVVATADDIVDPDDDPLVVALHAETEDALAAPPDHTAQWLEFREHWDDRAIDIDDEPSEARWPDPERVIERVTDLDRRVAEPACARHVRALVDCRSCGTLHCVECGGEDQCSACFIALAEPPSTDIPKHLP